MVSGDIAMNASNSAGAAAEEEETTALPLLLGLEEFCATIFQERAPWIPRASGMKRGLSFSLFLEKIP